MAISNAKILMHFSTETHGGNFIKRHSETVMVWNCQNADCSLSNKFYCVAYYNFRHTLAPCCALTCSSLRQASASAPFGCDAFRAALSSYSAVLSRSRNLPDFILWLTEWWVGDNSWGGRSFIGVSPQSKWGIRGSRMFVRTGEKIVF